LPKGDVPYSLAKACRSKGYKITAVPIKQLLSDLETVRHPASALPS
jgi:hypothetical protein